MVDNLITNSLYLSNKKEGFLSRACILTDSLIQFPSPIFEGRDIIYIIEHQLINNRNYIYTYEELRSYQFPNTLFTNKNKESVPKLVSPSAETIAQKLDQLTKNHEYVICFTSSKNFSEFFNNCKRAVEISGLQSKIFIIDSNSISLGQGILCQKLIQLIIEQYSISFILEKMRIESKNIYGIFYLKNFSYLYRSELLPYPSAVLSEMKKIKNTFILENGSFYATEKAKSVKNIIDIFENYANEFEAFEMISILQSKPAMSKITQVFKERITTQQSEFEISEQIISPYLSSILGPESTGIFFYEPLFL